MVNSSYILMEYYKHFHIISVGQSILYFKGSYKIMYFCP